MKCLQSLACAGLALALACGGDDEPAAEACSRPSDCAEPGTRCVNGFCVPRGGPGDAGADGSVDGDASVDAAAPPDGSVRDASSDVGSARDASAPDAGGPDAGLCGPVIEVSTLEQLVAQAPSAYGRPESAAWLSQESSSPDLRATATLTVLPGDFPAPTDCAECPVRLEQDSALAGVTDVSGGGLRIEPGAEFRMRFARVPGVLAAHAVVRFQRPCEALCLAGESRCEEDRACYATGTEYCNACEHDTAQRCACVGADGATLADGSGCSYANGFLLKSGTCRAGRCDDSRMIEL